ncbi:MAG: hypothetical protein QW607_00715 [Desulfurococcaceae archaeon]
MIWKISPVDVLSDNIENIVFILRRRLYSQIFKEKFAQTIELLSMRENAPKLYLRFLEKLVFYNVLLEYLNAKLNMPEEDTRLLKTGIIEVKTKYRTAIIKIQRPIIFLYEMALLGAYNTARLVDPYSKVPIKMLLASIFYDMFIYKLKRIRHLLETGKVQDAKKMIDTILEIDAKNIFNTIVPLDSLIKESVKIEDLDKKEVLKAAAIKNIYLYKEISDDELRNYTLYKLGEAISYLKNTIEKIKEENIKEAKLK